MKRKLYGSLLVFFILFQLFPSAAEAAPFEVSGKGAVLIEAESGRVLYEKNKDQQMRIASITKIMTAIIAIESGKLDETVKVSGNAAYTEGSSLYLKPGENIKLEDLVFGLMLRSGNDSAVAIAEHVGGSLDGFVFLMNEKAQEIGMTNTRFANPHGLDDHEEHYSTAYDMALLTKYAMKNEKYQEVAGTKTYRASQEGEDWDRVWSNKNRLLTQLYEYCTGGKTGYTKRAGRTLVTTAEKDDMSLIAVTINAPSDWNDHIKMYEWTFENYDMEVLAKEGLLKETDDPFYEKKVLIPYTYRYPLTEEEKRNVKQQIVLYEPPSEERADSYIPPQPVGKLEYSLNGEPFHAIALYFKRDTSSDKEEGFWAKLRGLYRALSE
ncbi:D-alanyl-D-alanine carboxypeptidase family protein [Thalassorhabdus alkalitolerans]|uniref:D-alanyl-D-alanine carboxypeptidase family protein n=1 Tax=Thalassorhabdus alkalitolerans TaxID=2282697 RepID=A0ABW0YNR4_9BACI